MSQSRTSKPQTSALPKVQAFGKCVEDLEVAFDFVHQVETAVTIVSRYSNKPRDWGWALSIGARTWQFIQIIQCSQDDHDLVYHPSCPEPDCGEQLELPIPLDALSRHGGDALKQGTELSWKLEKSREIKVRRATGIDQARWQELSFANNKEANRVLLETLVTEGHEHLPVLKPNHERQLSESMTDFDPLAAFRIETECPSCKSQIRIAVDLERLCLNRLARIQKGLLNAIHRLASAYGWTETEILKLSSKRRNFYLETIEEEELSLS